MTSVLDKALALAATGIPVFPCRSTPDHKPTDKTPACAHGLLDATTDPALIRELFSVPSAKLIGVPTGKRSGFDVLDLDPRHGSDAWEAANPLPVTRIHITQSGGKHVLFKSTGEKMPNSQSKIAPGLDVRGDGGFIIWWPAFGCEVWPDEDIAPWPANLDAVARAPKARTPRVKRITRAVNAPTPENAKEALADAVKTIEAAVEGERHETIRDICMAIASLVLGEMLDEDEAHEAILAAAEVCGAENMENVENLWSSAIEKASPAEPNTGDELGPLPPLDHDDDGDHDPDWWLGELIRGKPDKDGNAGPLVANLHNAMLYFRFHPDWRGKLKLNQFSNQIELDGRRMEDVDAINGAILAQKYGIGVAERAALNSMLAAAHRNRYHPVRDLLRSIVWDGVKRLDEWLIRYAAAEDTPLVRAFASKTLIGAVARVMVPGCKLDTVLILEGPQGLQKSSLFAVIAFLDEWFLDDLGAPDNKDTFDKLQGKWFVELAELDHMNRSDVATMKAFLSRRIDTYRVAYGRLTSDYPRQCVIVGTVNPGATGYLKDETGARRFWPVAIGVGQAEGWKIDLAGLKRDREQIYAEAVARYVAGEKWWLETAALEAMQRAAADERAEVDPWQEAVAAFLADKHIATIPEILTKAIGMDTDMHRKIHANAVGAILIRLGWSTRVIKIGGKPERRYVSPEYVRTRGACNVVTLRPPTLADLSA